MEIKNSVLAIIAGAGAMLSSVFGGWDVTMTLLVMMMVADYITGIMIAAFWQKSNKTEGGGLSSSAGFKGICKKSMVLFMVYLAVLLDGAMGSNYIRTAVIFFFIGNEGISLLENLGVMGVKYPAFIKNALEALQDKGNGGKDDS